MKNVQRFLEPNRRHGSIRVSVRGPSTASLSARGSAELRDAEGVADVLLDGRGILKNSRLDDPTQMQRFSSAANTRRTF
jgi:hypothetical protein